VIAHMGWPWIAETVMGLGRKNPNVYFDTGALRPSLHFGDVDFAAKVLYGSDFPNGDPKERVAGFNSMPLDPGFMGPVHGGQRPTTVEAVTEPLPRRSWARGRSLPRRRPSWCTIELYRRSEG